MTKLLDKFGFAGQDKRILMVGLDAAGKSTILYKMKLGEVITTIPTIGFNVEAIEYKNVTFTCWDVGGQSRIRGLWKHYFIGTDALIYVIDSNDPARLELAKEELEKMLYDPELCDADLLVFANKQDLPNAMSVKDIATGLGLPKLRGRKWHIQATAAIQGDGLFEGMDWLVQTIKTNSSSKSF